MTQAVESAGKKSLKPRRRTVARELGSAFGSAATETDIITGHEVTTRNGADLLVAKTAGAGEIKQTGKGLPPSFSSPYGRIKGARYASVAAVESQAPSTIRRAVTVRRAPRALRHHFGFPVLFAPPMKPPPIRSHGSARSCTRRPFASSAPLVRIEAP
jgi:hypothetical protein